MARWYKGRPQAALTLAALWWLFGVWMLFRQGGGHSGIPYFDKIGHFSLFAVQALLLLRGLDVRFGEVVARQQVWCCLCGWAVLSEVLQGTLTSYRSAEVADALADGLGIAAGLALARLRLLLAVKPV